MMTLPVFSQFRKCLFRDVFDAPPPPPQRRAIFKFRCVGYAYVQLSGEMWLLRGSSASNPKRRSSLSSRNSLPIFVCLTVSLHFRRSEIGSNCKRG